MSCLGAPLLSFIFRRPSPQNSTSKCRILQSNWGMGRELNGTYVPCGSQGVTCASLLEEKGSDRQCADNIAVPPPDPHTYTVCILQGGVVILAPPSLSDPPYPPSVLHTEIYRQYSLEIAVRQCAVSSQPLTIITHTFSMGGPDQPGPIFASPLHRQSPLRRVLCRSR